MNPFPKADELTRRQFVSNAARAYLGVHLFPMLGGTLASAAPATAAKGGTAKSVIYLDMSGAPPTLDLFDYKPFETWAEEGSRDTQALASIRVQKMLGDYQAPALDEGIRESLDAYVARRKSEMPDAFI